MLKGGRIRVRLKSWDHRIIDEAAAKIVDSAVTTGARVIGPVPLPTKRHVIVVTTGPHVDKNAREHFEVLTHQRLIDIDGAGNKTVDSLQHLELPAGVDITIKM